MRSPSEPAGWATSVGMVWAPYLYFPAFLRVLLPYLDFSFSLLYHRCLHCLYLHLPLSFLLFRGGLWNLFVHHSHCVYVRVCVYKHVTHDYSWLPPFPPCFSCLPFCPPVCLSSFHSPPTPHSWSSRGLCVLSQFMFFPNYGLFSTLGASGPLSLPLYMFSGPSCLCCPCPCPSVPTPCQVTLKETAQDPCLFLNSASART